jgi:hypothetical protein
MPSSSVRLCNLHRAFNNPNIYAVAWYLVLSSQYDGYSAPYQVLLHSEGTGCQYSRTPSHLQSYIVSSSSGMQFFGRSRPRSGIPSGRRCEGRLQELCDSLFRFRG